MMRAGVRIQGRGAYRLGEGKGAVVVRRILGCGVQARMKETERLGAVLSRPQRLKPRLICPACGTAESRALIRNGSIRGAEDFADFAGEGLQSEGFLEKSFLGIGGERCGESVLGVAREIEDFNGGARGEELLDEFVAAETRHDDVGNDEVDGFGVARGEGESGAAIGGFENVITAGCQSFADELTDGIFVLDEEDGFGSASGGKEDGSGAEGVAGFVDAREINGEDCTAGEFALDEDVAATLLDDSVDGGEAEAGALAFFFGSEKGLEDAGLSVTVHALAGVADGNHDVGTVFDESIFGAMGAVEGNTGGTNADFAAVGHGVFGIDHQIHDDLLKLSGIGASAADGGGELSGEFDIFSDEWAEEALHVGDDGVDVDDLELEMLFAAEGEELAGESGRAIGGLANGFGFGVQRMFRSELVEENLGISADDHEEVVEIVSDAAGEAADGFHFLGLAELVLEDTALGDVFGDGFENVGGFVAAGDGAPADANGDRGTVFAAPAGFEAVHASGAAEFFDQAGVLARLNENIFLGIEGEDFKSGVVAEHSDEGGVDVEKTTFKAGAVDSVDGCLHQRAVAQLGAAESLLVAFAVDGGG